MDTSRNKLSDLLIPGDNAILSQQIHSQLLLGNRTHKAVVLLHQLLQLNRIKLASSNKAINIHVTLIDLTIKTLQISQFIIEDLQLAAQVVNFILLPYFDCVRLFYYRV
jgi:hypothetical protein